MSSRRVRRLRLALLVSFPLLAWTRVAGAFGFGNGSRDDGVLVSRELSEFNAETQNFAPGFGGDDFHVQVPRGRSMQRLALEGRKIVETRLRIDGFAVVSNYAIAPAGGQALVSSLADSIGLNCRRCVPRGSAACGRVIFAWPMAASCTPIP